MGLLRMLGKTLSFDLTGRSWTREVDHPYFTNLVYFGFKDTTSSYWEAELFLPGSNAPIGVSMEGSEAGPTAEEEAFCRRLLADPGSVFSKCRELFEPEFQKWAKSPMPQSWRDAFRVDGFSVPRDGNQMNNWDICYFVEPAGHYFTAAFVGGEAVSVLVDG